MLVPGENFWGPSYYYKRWYEEEGPTEDEQRNGLHHNLFVHEMSMKSRYAIANIYDVHRLMGG